MCRMRCVYWGEEILKILGQDCSRINNMNPSFKKAEWIQDSTDLKKLHLTQSVLLSGWLWTTWSSFNSQPGHMWAQPPVRGCAGSSPSVKKCLGLKIQEGAHSQGSASGESDLRMNASWILSLIPCLPHSTLDQASVIMDACMQWKALQTGWDRSS